jgi:alpha-tubulin suppressor-like RCC1 family protein
MTPTLVRSPRAVAVWMLFVMAALAFTPPASALGAQSRIPDIAAGSQHSCMIYFDTTVLCWGLALTGQLGDGSTGDPATNLRLEPVEVRSGPGALTGAIAVTAGFGHTCALKRNGTVWCWGWDLYGQLGDGSRGDVDGRRLHPVKVRQGNGYLTGVTAISAGALHTCARRGDGSLWCWGDGQRGQLGDGASGPGGLRLKATRVHLGKGPLTDVVGVASGGSHTCAWRADGSAWCWGDASAGQIGDGTFGDPISNRRLVPRRVRQAGGPLGGVSRIESGDYHTCATTSGGRVWCWGDAFYGQVGDGTRGGVDETRTTAVRVLRGSGKLTEITSLAMGGTHSCARRKDGTVWCWGQAADGQVGDGTTGNANQLRLRAVQVSGASGPFARVRRVATGSDHTCAIRRLGAWCWGRASSGQLGIGSADGSPHPLPERILLEA